MTLISKMLTTKISKTLLMKTSSWATKMKREEKELKSKWENKINSSSKTKYNTLWTMCSDKSTKTTKASRTSKQVNGTTSKTSLKSTKKYSPLNTIQKPNPTLSPKIIPGHSLIPDSLFLLWWEVSNWKKNNSKRFFLKAPWLLHFCKNTNEKWQCFMLEWSEILTTLWMTQK